jgi:polyhydroxybutyrate depolymerase
LTLIFVIRIALLAWLLPASTAHALAPGDHYRSIEVDGLPRSYVLHLPANARVPLPLVVVLHGAGGSGIQAEAGTGMTVKAEREGFAVVYPNGVSPFSNLLRTWNAGACCHPAAGMGVDDVGFLRTMLGEVKRLAPIDPDRVFVTGFSNGAMMAYRLACEIAGEITAIAPVAGTLETQCQPSAPVSVLAVHGLVDGRVPFNGGDPPEGRLPGMQSLTSVPESLAFWARHNGCDEKPVLVESKSVVHQTWTGCEQAPVGLIALRNGRHAWPGGRKILPWEVEPNSELSATDAIWEFFAGQGKVRKTPVQGDAPRTQSWRPVGPGQARPAAHDVSSISESQPSATKD